MNLERSMKNKDDEHVVLKIIMLIRVVISKHEFLNLLELVRTRC